MLLQKAKASDAEVAAAVAAAILPLVSRPGGRLTNSTGVPVLTAAVASAATVFYTPYITDKIPLWSSTLSAFVMTTFTELSNVLANSSTGSAGPAAAAADQNYDMFVWSNGGTPTLTRGPVWTSATARSAGTGLTMVQGIYTNTQAITNGPGAGAGTYVGTIRTDAGGATVSWQPGGAAAGGTMATLYIWNMYNRVRVTAMVRNSTASWTYNSATIRAANGSATFRISFIRGLDEDSISAAYWCHTATPATAGSFGQIGVGLDVTNNFSGPIGRATAPTAAVFSNILKGEYHPLPGSLIGVGFHFLSGNESTDTTTVTFTANSLFLNALVAEMWF